MRGSSSEGKIKMSFLVLLSYRRDDVIHILDRHYRGVSVYKLHEGAPLGAALGTTDDVHLPQLAVRSEHVMQVLLIDRLGEHADKQLVLPLSLILRNAHLKGVDSLNEVKDIVGENMVKIFLLQTPWLKLTTQGCSALTFGSLILSCS